jgi:hypothetical protein
LLVLDAFDLTFGGVGPRILTWDVLRIVDFVAQPRMCLQLFTVGQIDPARGDVINRGAAVGIERRRRLIVN